VIALEAGGFWWDLRGAGARIHAIAFALHDFFWACLALMARKTERAMKRFGVALRLQSRVGRLDGALLRAAHRLMFERLHQRSLSPPDSGCYTASLPD
jgi:hypothetical protein